MRLTLFMAYQSYLVERLPAYRIMAAKAGIVFCSFCMGTEPEKHQDSNWKVSRPFAPTNTLAAPVESLWVERLIAGGYNARVAMDWEGITKAQLTLHEIGTSVIA